VLGTSRGGASVQRGKLLDKTRSLASIAASARCGRRVVPVGGQAGCHCQQDGPKHGPYLDVRYCGEKRARHPQESFLSAIVKKGVPREDQ